MHLSIISWRRESWRCNGVMERWGRWTWQEYELLIANQIFLTDDFSYELIWLIFSTTRDFGLAWLLDGLLDGYAHCICPNQPCPSWYGIALWWWWWYGDMAMCWWPIYRRQCNNILQSFEVIKVNRLGARQVRTLEIDTTEKKLCSLDKQRFELRHYRSLVITQHSSFTTRPRKSNHQAEKSL